jgi:hypothetical protein
MMQSKQESDIGSIDEVDQYINAMPESLHDIIYYWDRPHQVYRSMLDMKKDINVQKPYSIIPRKTKEHELAWFENILNENAFFRGKKIEERKLLYQICKCFLLCILHSFSI